jgi:predicted nucleic acid-binding protein
VTSQRHTFGGRPLTPNEAWSNYVRWRGQSEVTILTEPLGIDDIMGNWIDRGLATTKNWTDLYLAAFATAGRLRLVTFDSDFAAFPGLDLLQLKG